MGGLARLRQLKSWLRRSRRDTPLPCEVEGSIDIILPTSLEVGVCPKPEPSVPEPITMSDEQQTEEEAELLRRISKNSEQLAASISAITSSVHWHEVRRRMDERACGYSSGGSGSGSPQQSSSPQWSNSDGFACDDEEARELIKLVRPRAASDRSDSSSGRGSGAFDRPPARREGASSSHNHGTRLRSMSAPEVRDAIERADMDARLKKWTKKHGSLTLTLPQKLQELEAKALRLSEKAAKHQAIADDEALPNCARPHSNRRTSEVLGPLMIAICDLFSNCRSPHALATDARALSAAKLQQYQRKSERALRLSALLEEQRRAAPRRWSHSNISTRSAQNFPPATATRHRWSHSAADGNRGITFSPSVGWTQPAALASSPLALQIT